MKKAKILKLQAQEHVLRLTIRKLESSIPNGSEWLVPEGMNDSDHGKLQTELENLIDHLKRRHSKILSRLQVKGQLPL